MKNRKATRHILTLLIVVFAMLFCVSAYMLFDYYWQGHKAEKAFDEVRSVITEVETETSGNDYAEMQAALKKLYDKNNDFVGWLKVFDTNIDYPVMHTPKDPEYYLHRNFDKEDSVPGALFASSISDIAKPSSVIIIYGHHMKNGTMFGPLMKYEDKEYYTSHRYMRFDTLEERRCYEITNVFKISVDADFKYYDYSDFVDQADYTKFIDEINKLSIYNTGVESSFGDEFVMLSTCEYSQKNGRLVLLAKRVPEDSLPAISDSGA